MKARAALAVVLVVLGALAAAGPALALQPAGAGWFWQSPQPQGAHLNDVSFGGAHDVWAVGDGGTILCSGDAGVTWQPQGSPTTEPLGSVDFVDATHGWATGGVGWDSVNAGVSRADFTGVILGTADGGATWTEQAAFSGKAVADVCFVNDTAGWAVGSHGLIVHTADGGQTWAPQASGIKRDLTSVAFTDAAHGYAASGATSGVVLATADGGATWKRVGTRDQWMLWPGVSSLAVDADGTLWAALGARGTSGNFSRLASSPDGGRTWHAAGVGMSFAVWHVGAAGRQVWAVGAADGDGIPGDGASRVLTSTDGGATWERHSIGSDVVLDSVDFADPDTGCAVGDLTVTTGDRGATWYGRSTRALGGAGFDFVSPTEGWSAGLGTLLGTLLFSDAAPASVDSVSHTADGARWTEQLEVPGGFIFDLAFADASNGWVVGLDGLVRHTTDGGATWTAQQAGTGLLLESVAATSARSAWILGLDMRAGDTTVFHTQDGGADWAEVALPGDLPRPLMAVDMSWVGADQGWLLAVGNAKKGSQRIVLHTADAGRTWTRQPLDVILGTAIPLTVDFVDAQHGWVLALGETGDTVLTTSDGGSTWDVVASQSAFGTDTVGSLSFVDALQGWASGQGIYHTTDGGHTWTREAVGLPLGTSITAFDATHAWAAAGGIVSTVDSAGDTAAPVTLPDAAGGWSRTSVALRLTAADVGTSGLASTVYRIDGGAWTPGLVLPVFEAPADHSGDGSHVVEYRSADMAGNIEPTQRQTVKIDTVRPVVRLGRSVVGRDGVLRFRLRIDDRSCPSVGTYNVRITRLHGRQVASLGGEGARLRTNSWITLRYPHVGEFIPAGTYRVSFTTSDRAGNRAAHPGRGSLLVKPHKTRQPPLPGALGLGAMRHAARPAEQPAIPAARVEALRGRLQRLVRRIVGDSL